DVPATAWTKGARILENEGVCGTFYIAGVFIDTQDEQQEMISTQGCSELAAAGHELACHTYSHRKLSSFSRRGLEEDLDRNESVLGSFNQNGHKRNFSVPFGMASPLMQPLLRRRFRTARGITAGINRGSIDPYNLAAVELRPDQNYLNAADRWLEDVLQNGGWLIIFTHDVSRAPSFYGCPEDRLQGLVRRAVSGGAKVMPVDAAVSALSL
ncbi:MAG TPA: polysaccharide deacetylase, partial [Agrobacterium sp.]|uniref:polysaccharide deacetylase family protein n=1 Tax=Rhizobium sp. TaxID=391 RepID=UPI000EE5432A|nr:polysaccharide deacetylase [Agrobacterium sp.]